MAQVREELLYNGTGAGPDARRLGAFDLQEVPIVVAAANLGGPVTIQVLQPVLNMWFDVMVGGKPMQLTDKNTFRILTIQGAYRIKPGEASGQGVIWFREVSHVPEWDWWNDGDLDESGDGGEVPPPPECCPIKGSVALDVCVGCQPLKQWLLTENGLPTGEVSYTDASGALVSLPADAVVIQGACPAGDAVVASAKGPDVSSLPPGKSISIQKPPCCEVKVTTSAGSFIVAQTAIGYATGDFEAPVTVISAEILSGTCSLADVIVTVIGSAE